MIKELRLIYWPRPLHFFWFFKNPPLGAPLCSQNEAQKPNSLWSGSLPSGVKTKIEKLFLSVQWGFKKMGYVETKSHFVFSPFQDWIKCCVFVLFQFQRRTETIQGPDNPRLPAPISRPDGELQKTLLNPLTPLFFPKKRFLTLIFWHTNFGAPYIPGFRTIWHWIRSKARSTAKVMVTGKIFTISLLIMAPQFF